MSEFPARDRLIQVAGSLVRRLPGQLGTLLAAPRFEDGRGALLRLSDPEVLAQGAAAMAPDEAAWLAELLLERWSLIGDVELDPAVAIVGPDDIWLSHTSREVVYTIATLGVEGGWTAQWTGDVQPSADSRRAVLTAHPPEDDQDVTARMTVRLMGRAEGRRCILVATHTVRLRRLVLAIDEGRKRLVFCDHTGVPAAGVEVEIDEQCYTTQSNGLLELPAAIDESTVVRVAGERVASGR